MGPRRAGAEAASADHTESHRVVRSLRRHERTRVGFEKAPQKIWIPHLLSRAMSGGNLDPPPTGVVERLGFEHGHEDEEQAVSDAAQGSALAVSAGPEGLIVLVRGRVMVGRDER